MQNWRLSDILYTVEFEYDPAKSKTNKTKHGIDFSEVQLLWMDSDAVELEARMEGEPRFLVVGKIDG